MAGKRKRLGSTLWSQAFCFTIYNSPDALVATCGTTYCRALVLELFCESEIQLLASKISLSHDDLYLVTQGESTARMTPHKSEVRLIIDVLVVGEITSGHETFTLILLQLDVDPPVGKASDDPRELLPEPWYHVLDLLILNRGTLGCRC